MDGNVPEIGWVLPTLQFRLAPVAGIPEKVCSGANRQDGLDNSNP